MNIRNTRLRKNKHSLSFARLEPRQLLASIYHNPDTGVLYIAGDNGDNVGEVSTDGDRIDARVDDQNFSGQTSTVTEVVFIGYDGDDNFSNDSSLASSMFGHRGNDILSGGEGNDNLVGGPGDDIASGFGGDDRIVGVLGDDTLRGGDGNDKIFGTEGENTLFGGEGDDLIYGGPEADEIHGDAGDDTVYALNGENLIFGGDGNDSLTGGFQDDEIYAGAGRDRVLALGGDDVLHSGPGGVEGGAFEEADVLRGNAGNDTFFGENGLDIFLGGDGDDFMAGGSGESRMFGHGGDDTITVGSKKNFVKGGNGEDRVVVQHDYVDQAIVSLAAGITVDGDFLGDIRWVEFNDRTISGNQAVYSIVNGDNFDLLNDYRETNNRVPLSKPVDLAEYARNWSLEMARRNQLVHSPNSDQIGLLTNGRTQAGENVGWVSDIGQSESAVASYFQTQWQNSASHKANMLKGSFREVGIGIVNSGGRWWATQIYVG